MPWWLYGNMFKAKKNMLGWKWENISTFQSHHVNFLHRKMEISLPWWQTVENHCLKLVTIVQRVGTIAECQFLFLLHWKITNYHISRDFYFHQNPDQHWQTNTNYCVVVHWLGCDWVAMNRSKELGLLFWAYRYCWWNSDR